MASKSAETTGEFLTRLENISLSTMARRIKKYFPINRVRVANKRHIYYNKTGTVTLAERFPHYIACVVQFDDAGSFLFRDIDLKVIKPLL